MAFSRKIPYVTIDQICIVILKTRDATGELWLWFVSSLLVAFYSAKCNKGIHNFLRNTTRNNFRQ